VGFIWTKTKVLIFKWILEVEWLELFRGGLEFILPKYKVEFCGGLPIFSGELSMVWHGVITQPLVAITHAHKFDVTAADPL